MVLDVALQYGLDGDGDGDGTLGVDINDAGNTLLDDGCAMTNISTTERICADVKHNKQYSMEVGSGCKKHKTGVEVEKWKSGKVPPLSSMDKTRSIVVFVPHDLLLIQSTFAFFVHYIVLIITIRCYNMRFSLTALVMMMMMATCTHAS